MIDMRAQKKKEEKAGNDTERKHRKHKYIQMTKKHREKNGSERRQREHAERRAKQKHNPDDE